MISSDLSSFRSTFSPTTSTSITRVVKSFFLGSDLVHDLVLDDVEGEVASARARMCEKYKVLLL